MRLPLLTLLATSALTLAHAEPGPTAVVLCNLSNEDVYLTNLLAKHTKGKAEVTMTYNEDPEIRKRRPPVTLSPWPTIGQPATFLVRGGEAVFLEAAQPAQGQVLELAVLSGDGKRRCSMLYSVVAQGDGLGARLEPATKAAGASFDVDGPAFLFFTGFTGK